MLKEIADKTVQKHVVHYYTVGKLSLDCVVQ